MSPDEASGFSTEPGYVDDLARVLADMPLHGVDRTAELEAEAAMMRFALAEADAEIHRLNRNREHIIQLAVDHEATIMAECDDCQRERHKHLFADLIRQKVPQ